MAEVVILGALKLLGEALASQFMKQATSQASQFLSSALELEERMKNISLELEVMQAFLDQVDIHNQSNKAYVKWIEQVQTVANQIKDIMDEFMNRVGNKKIGGLCHCIIRTFKEPKSLVALKQITTKLEKADKQLIRVGEIKDRWLITDAGTGSSTNHAIETSVQVAHDAHFIDDKEIVGIDETRTKMTCMINSEDPHCNVISVWGMPGVGKTTLVTNVFKRERNKFTRYAWICISQEYKVDQVLRDLISNICKNHHINPISTKDMDMRELKETTRDLLQNRRYLIVLDDAWDENSFMDIRDIFVDYNQGSRIIITTRIANVAYIARENNRLELNPLPYTEAWTLFCGKAFQNEENHECPPHLDEWAKIIVSKCDGLPLALVSIGSVLSSCANNESEWKRVHDQLSFEWENNKSLGRLRCILKLSFDYLPMHLKKCFLYCCMFPEDHLLARKRMIRLWIAEEFVEQRGKSTLEEIAEGYLQELINRSMLQVAEKNEWNRVKRFRIHDTLRELGISLCLKENFCLLYGDGKPVYIEKNVRRLSVFKSGDKIGNHVNLPLLRTFMSFDLSLVTTEFLKYSRSLTVLNLENISIQIVPDNIGDLLNLRYLGLRNTKVKFLPNSIGKLHNLQTLDLYETEIEKLPNEIAQLKKLRHLFAEAMVDNTGSFRSRTGVNLPVGMFNLEDLQTIQALESNDVVIKELGNLTQLRSLRIMNVKENHSVELCKSLSRMSFMSFLSINASNENEILHLERLVLPKIEKFCLRGRLRGTMLHSPLFQTCGEHIKLLSLRSCQLQNDPLSSLFHLRNLAFLNLRQAFEGQELIFQARCFPKLKYLELTDMPNLINVEMEQGTMVSLEKVVLRQLKKLEDIPKGMEHLISLKRMICRDMSAGFGGLTEGTHELFHFTCYVL